MNEKLFQPHCLYCLIMTYKPNSQNFAELRLREGRRQLGDSNIEMYGELELPEAAPLIFPALDEAAAAMGQDPQKQNALKKSQKFVADYFDRRSHATYVWRVSSLSTRSKKRDVSLLLFKCVTMSLKITPSTHRTKPSHTLLHSAPNPRNLLLATAIPIIPPPMAP